MNAILVKPLITEKSMQDATSGEYTFVVGREANKVAIAQSVAASFGVKVVSVKTTTHKGKTKRSGKTRQQFLTSPWKKAMVKLTKGQKIDLFDVTENQVTK